MRTFYQILQIREDASQEEVKKAYRTLAKKHHPDKGGSDEEFLRISEAYESLKTRFSRDSASRAKFSSGGFRGGFEFLGDFIKQSGFEVGSIHDLVEKCAHMKIFEVLDVVRELKRSGNLEVALSVLMLLISWTEAEQSVYGCVAPGYYEEAAIVLRKLGRKADEIAVLERFEKQRHGLGICPGKLMERLAKLRSKSTKIHAQQ